MPNGAVPDGTIDIIFDCSADFPLAFVAGTVEKGAQNIFQQNHTYFGVRFLPGILDHFGNASTKELTGTSLEFTDVTRRGDIAEKICTASSLDGQVHLFLAAFSETAQMTSYTGNSAVMNEMLNEIYKSNGNIKVQELEAKLSYSRRHLLRLFRESAGLDIKKFCRIIRFQSFLSKMNEGVFSSFAAAALESGYYDQSHLQKDFREFALATPRIYRRILESSGYWDKITLVE